MKPADPREVMQIALFNARRLSRDLGTMARSSRPADLAHGGIMTVLDEIAGEPSAPVTEDE